MLYRTVAIEHGVWPEINSRVNYPIKIVLQQLEVQRIIDMHDSTHRFCVSWCTIRVANAGARLAVASWNEHPIPSMYVLHQYNGTVAFYYAMLHACCILIIFWLAIIVEKGIPNILAQENSRIRPLDASCLVEPEEIVQEFTSHGGSITTFSPFGVDPLASSATLMAERGRRHSCCMYRSYDEIFHHLVNGDPSLFKTYIEQFIDITLALSTQTDSYN